MIDKIVVDGDLLTFSAVFGHRSVSVIGTAVIKGTGHATVQKKRICIMGDEKKVRVPALYQIPGFNPGQGTITIVSLMPNQEATNISTGAMMIVKGQKFIAHFTPTVPAVNVSSGIPDPSVPTVGFGSFVIQQTIAYAKS